MWTPTAAPALCALACSLAAVGGKGNDDDWVDPYDMLNYDINTKTMRKPAEPVNYPKVSTKRREYNQDMDFNKKEEELQKEVEDQKKILNSMAQQHTCSLVFRRFLARFLKLTERVSLLCDHEERFFNGKVRLTGHGVAEIQKLLEGSEIWRPGVIDDALSHLLVDLKPLDHEAWKWRFEDTFGVDIDTVLKVLAGVFIIVLIICTELWSVVSWFVQFKRLFSICFFISIVWNWFYLYKTAFAEHQNSMTKMDSVYGKCTGVEKIDWKDSLKEWFRSTWTLQDDPCKKYYEVLMVNPILLVPPTKAISVTITTFITEPLKHFGQGISEFLRALLKDLPVTLQIPVLITIVLSILVIMYGGVHAAFQHGITGPLRRHHRGPPPPEVDQPQHPRLRNRDYDLAGGDALQPTPRPDRLERGEARRRSSHRANVPVETIRNTDRSHSQDDTKTRRRESPMNQEPLDGHSASDSDSQTEGDSVNLEKLPGDTSLKLARDPPAKHTNLSEAEKQEENLPSEKAGNDSKLLEASPEEKASVVSVEYVETIGAPVQEMAHTE